MERDEEEIVFVIAREAVWNDFDSGFSQADSESCKRVHKAYSELTDALLSHMRQTAVMPPFRGMRRRIVSKESIAAIAVELLELCCHVDADDESTVEGQDIVLGTRREMVQKATKIIQKHLGA